ncbi:MAG: PD-(D/E)XK nuclease domain-containing protein [Lachnospiraceae bacterium]|nr:PD-(D/E)XK nuclease domain-containing protein [Lachnospiraceae bacterium]
MLRISDGALESECQEALDQIERMQYARNLRIEGFRTVLCYGVAFLGKNCLIRLAKEKTTGNMVESVL